MPEKLAQKLAK